MADKIRGQGPEGERMGDTPDFTDADLEVAGYLLDRRGKEAKGRPHGQGSRDRHWRTPCRPPDDEPREGGVERPRPCSSIGLPRVLAPAFPRGRQLPSAI